MFACKMVRGAYMEAEAERVAELSRVAANAANAASDGAASGGERGEAASGGESGGAGSSSGSGAAAERFDQEMFDPAAMYERFFPSPVHASKVATDAAYDGAVSDLAPPPPPSLPPMRLTPSLKPIVEPPLVVLLAHPWTSP